MIEEKVPASTFGKRKKREFENRTERVSYVLTKREMANLDKLRGLDGRNYFARRTLQKLLEDQGDIADEQ